MCFRVVNSIIKTNHATVDSEKLVFENKVSQKDAIK